MAEGNIFTEVISKAWEAIEPHIQGVSEEVKRAIHDILTGDMSYRYYDDKINKLSKAIDDEKAKPNPDKYKIQKLEQNKHDAEKELNRYTARYKRGVRVYQDVIKQHPDLPDTLHEALKKADVKMPRYMTKSFFKKPNTKILTPQQQDEFNSIMKGIKDVEKSLDEGVKPKQIKTPEPPQANIVKKSPTDLVKRPSTDIANRPPTDITKKPQGDITKKPQTDMAEYIYNTRVVDEPGELPPPRPKALGEPAIPIEPEYERPIQSQQTPQTEQPEQPPPIDPQLQDMIKKGNLSQILKKLGIGAGIAGAIGAYLWGRNKQNSTTQQTAKPQQPTQQPTQQPQQTKPQQTTLTQQTKPQQPTKGEPNFSNLPPLKQLLEEGNPNPLGLPGGQPNNLPSLQKLLQDNGAPQIAFDDPNALLNGTPQQKIQTLQAIHKTKQQIANTTQQALQQANKYQQIGQELQDNSMKQQIGQKINEQAQLINSASKQLQTLNQAEMKLVNSLPKFPKLQQNIKTTLATALSLALIGFLGRRAPIATGSFISNFMLAWYTGNQEKQKQALAQYQNELNEWTMKYNALENSIRNIETSTNMSYAQKIDAINLKLKEQGLQDTENYHKQLLFIKEQLAKLQALKTQLEAYLKQQQLNIQRQLANIKAENAQTERMNAYTRQKSVSGRNQYYRWKEKQKTQQPTQTNTQLGGLLPPPQQ
ncbi:MAG: hypothetical protein QW575_07930 [Thermoproteota archaeon]